MAIGVWLFIGWMALVAITALAMFVWGLERGQFRNLEEPARRMLRDDDTPAPRPETKAEDKKHETNRRGETRDR